MRQVSAFIAGLGNGFAVHTERAGYRARIPRLCEPADLTLSLSRCILPVNAIVNNIVDKSSVMLARAG